MFLLNMKNSKCRISIIEFITEKIIMFLAVTIHKQTNSISVFLANQAQSFPIPVLLCPYLAVLW